MSRSNPGISADIDALYGTPESADAQRTALRSGSVPVAVYGLGKIGLPLATAYADLTGNVIGVDIDDTVVERVNRGESVLEHEAGLSDLVADCVERGALTATTDAAAAAKRAAVHILIVPVPLGEDRREDLSSLESAASDVGTGLTSGDLVVVESTVPVGTSRETVTPILEAESGLDRTEFGVACCPERVSSGSALADIRGTHPRVVGGIDDESTRATALLYGELVDNDIVRVSDSETAEASKLFEGVYRDVNIALANELGRCVDDLGIDVIEAIEAANTQPYCDLHRPGAGVGGHCIPYYPYFLTTRVETPMELIRTAREGNDSMPAFVVQKTIEKLAANGRDVLGGTVLVLGVTYRPGIDETSATPAEPIIEGFRERGATVMACDPVLEGDTAFGVPLVSVESLADRNPDAVVLVTAHEEFLDIDWSEFEDIVIVDGRDALDVSEHPTYTVGRGSS